MVEVPAGGRRRHDQLRRDNQPEEEREGSGRRRWCDEMRRYWHLGGIGVSIGGTKNNTQPENEKGAARGSSA